jgi:hypothetical protein
MKSAHIVGTPAFHPQPYPGAPPTKNPGTPNLDEQNYTGPDTVVCRPVPQPPLIASAVHGAIETLAGGLGASAGAAVAGPPGAFAGGVVGGGIGSAAGTAVSGIPFPFCTGGSNGHGGSDGNGYWPGPRSTAHR